MKVTAHWIMADGCEIQLRMQFARPLRKPLAWWVELPGGIMAVCPHGSNAQISGVLRIESPKKAAEQKEKP